MAAVEPVEYTPEQIRVMGARARAARIREARDDPYKFNEYVLRHERTNESVLMPPMHSEWHEVLTANKRAILWGHIEAGKTIGISTGRTLFELGKDTSRRLLTVSNSQGGAKKIVKLLSQYMMRSRELRQVFPHLRPATPWTQTELVVERPFFSKDPSVQALGVHGDVIGSRVDGCIMDDVLDYENTRTSVQRLELRSWFEQSILGRLTADAYLWILGNAYYPDDLLHWLAAERSYFFRKYPIRNAAGEISFPQEWNDERITKKEDELGGKDSPEAQRQLYCKPRSEDASRVKEEWIQQCLERGLGVAVLEQLTPEDIADATAGAATPAIATTGVDLGIKRHKGAAKSAVFTLLNYPPLPGQKWGDRQLVALKSGRWAARDTILAVLSARDRFGSTCHVEDNGAQDVFLQIAHGEVGGDIGEAGNVLTVLPFHTGGNKTHPVYGVESIFAELARGQWIIPSIEGPGGKLQGATPEIREWLQQMLDYTPATHTGDALMAAWMAKEGARLAGARNPGVGVKIIGQDVSDSLEVEKGLHPEKGNVRPELRGWEALIRRR